MGKSCSLLLETVPSSLDAIVEEHTRRYTERVQLLDSSEAPKIGTHLYGIPYGGGGSSTVNAALPTILVASISFALALFLCVMDCRRSDYHKVVNFY